MKYTLLFLIITHSFFCLTAQNDVQTVNNLFANHSGFTLFSLSENKIIPNQDSASNLWHIGFRGTNIIINSMSSGPGSVLAQVVSVGFDELNQAPNSGFSADSASNKRAIIGASGASWYEYLPQCSHVIKPIPNRTIVLKAGVDYYKIRIISYYLNSPELPDCPTASVSGSRNYTFEYQKIESLTHHSDKNDIKSSIRLFPNPVSSDELTVEGLNDGISIEIYHGTGVLMKSATIINGKIDLNGLSNGTFFMKYSVAGKNSGSALFIKK